MAEQAIDTQNAAAQEVAALVARSRAAQAQIEHYSQEQDDELIRAMVWSVARPGVAEKIFISWLSVAVSRTSSSPCHISPRSMS